MRCKPLGSSNAYTGRATPGWIAWPIHIISNDAIILPVQCAQLNGKLIGQIWLYFWVPKIFNKFEGNIDECLHLVSGHHQGLHDYHPTRLHTSQSHGVQSWVSRELDSSLGGEKIIFAMLHTHVGMLASDVYDSHACVRHLCWVTNLCGYIHDKGFT